MSAPGCGPYGRCTLELGRGVCGGVVLWERLGDRWRGTCQRCDAQRRASTVERRSLEHDAGPEPVITGVIELPVDLVQAVSAALLAWSLSTATQGLAGRVESGELARKLGVRLREQGDA